MGAEQTRKPRSGAERRQALVDAAFGCIAEKGFEGLRLRDVASEVGIDHLSLHYHFPTKEDLVAEAVQYATRQFWPTMPAEAGPAENLHYHLAAPGRMIEERPALFAVLSELGLRARRDTALRSIIDRHEVGWRQALTEVLRHGAKETVLAEERDAAARVELIIAVVKGLGLNPGEARDVLHQLERLLVGQSPDGDIFRRASAPGDLILARFLQELRLPGGIAGSQLSSADSAVWLLLVAALAATLLRRRWPDALFVFLASLTAVLMGVALKLQVARPRPSSELVRVYDPSQTYSFPSITAIHSAVLLGVIVYLIWRVQPARPVRVVALGTSSLLILVIGLSRVYAGEHWATDVLGGWLLGAACLLPLVAAHRRWLAMREGSQEKQRAIFIHHPLRLLQGDEPVLVQAFVAESAVERLDEGIIDRFARS